MKNNKEEKVTSISTENIYKLNGRVPLKKSYSIWLTTCTCNVCI